MAVIVAEGVMPCHPVVPERHGTVVPLETAGVFGPGHILVRVIKEQLAFLLDPSLDAELVTAGMLSDPERADSTDAPERRQRHPHSQRQHGA